MKREHYSILSNLKPFELDTPHLYRTEIIEISVRRDIDVRYNGTLSMYRTSTRVCRLGSIRSTMSTNIRPILMDHSTYSYPYDTMKPNLQETTEHAAIQCKTLTSLIYVRWPTSSLERFAVLQLDTSVRNEPELKLA